MTFLPSVKSLAIGRERTGVTCASRVADERMSQWCYYNFQMTFLPSVKSLAIGRECTGVTCASRVADKR